MGNGGKKCEANKAASRRGEVRRLPEYPRLVPRNPFLDRAGDGNSNAPPSKAPAVWRSHFLPVPASALNWWEGGFLLLLLSFPHWLFLTPNTSRFQMSFFLLAGRLPPPTQTVAKKGSRAPLGIERMWMSGRMALCPQFAAWHSSAFLNFIV
jgi:hypothetical protein